MTMPAFDWTNHTRNDSADGSYSVTVPSHSSGDAIVFIMVNGSASNAFAGDGSELTDSGYTYLGDFGDTASDGAQAWWIKEGDGAISSVNYTTPNSFPNVAMCVIATDIDFTSGPVNVTGTVATGTSTTVGVNVPTSTAADCLFVLGATGDGAYCNPVSITGTGWTDELEESCGVDGSGNSFNVFHFEQTSAGTPTSPTVTQSQTEGYGSIIFAFLGTSGAATGKLSGSMSLLGVGF